MIRRNRLVAVVVMCALVAPLYAAQAAPLFKVLLFTKTSGERHASIPAAINAIKSLGSQNNFQVDATEDATVFTETNLAQYQAVIFALTSGDVLSPVQQDAFESYISKGGGFSGIHSAANTENDPNSPWTWYQDLVGAQWESATSNTPLATIVVADHVHPSTSALPWRWSRSDEWVNFKTNPRGKVHTLATVNEKTYSGGTDGYDHPIAWCQGYKGGRSWYTAGGHTTESWTTDSAFLNHVLGGIKYAAGNAVSDCGATIESAFDKVVLDYNMNQPMSLAVLPDNRVMFIERFGNVKIYKPGATPDDAGTTVLAAKLNVSYEYDHGLQGLAIDPNFSSNGFIYLYYTAPPIEGAPAPNLEKSRLSRFTLSGDSLSLSSEQLILTFPVLGHCCHQGGDLTFDNAGNLLLSIGDDTAPGFSDGYAPIDERQDHYGDDAQRTAGNKFSLQGKIIRISPIASPPQNCSPGVGCTYNIPAGNLFPADGSSGLPEIYGMGMRNPFRMSFDTETGWLYSGDVGPDANYPNSNRGPEGRDEINQMRGPSNLGWPYCISNSMPYNTGSPGDAFGTYRDYDFATQLPKNWFDCNAPVNDSPNANSSGGSQVLPEAKPAMIAYHYGVTAEYPQLGLGGRAAMAGPVYHYDPSVASDRKFPQYYDDTLFIYDWARSWIKEVKLDSTGNVLQLNDFMPGTQFKGPIDMQFAPDGSLYVLEFGSTYDYANYYGAQLVRLDYVNGKRRPVIDTSKTAPTAGAAPLAVTLSAEGSFDPDQDDRIVSYEWDFTNNGSVDATTMRANTTYPRGNWSAKLTLTDSTGKVASRLIDITSGNHRPQVTLDNPPDGKFHPFGDQFKAPYKIRVTDTEDGSTDNGTISCADVKLTTSIAHTIQGVTHVHPTNTLSGCAGEIFTADKEHGLEANFYTSVRAFYTDRGAGEVRPITGETIHLVYGPRREAEYYTSQSGLVLKGSNDIIAGGAAGGTVVFAEEPGSWLSFSRVNLQGVRAIGFRVSSATTGGRIEVRVGGPQGQIIGQALAPPTENWTIYEEVVTTVTDPGGTNDLYFVFAPVSPVPVYWYLDRPVGGLMMMNWLDFLAAPSITPPPPKTAPAAATISPQQLGIFGAFS